jgi:sedoheptulokinase
MAAFVPSLLSASWGLLDLRRRRWHAPLLARLGIPPEILPEIAPACRPLGPVICPKLSKQFPRMMVFSPVGDNQAGFAGCAGAGAGEAVVNLGTSSQISVFAPEFRFDPEIETRPFPGGGFLRVHAALCGGWAYAYLADFYRQVAAQIAGVELTPEAVFERMLAFGETADAAGLSADTRFAGARDGRASAGAIRGINTANLTPANLARAFALGIAAELAGPARRSGLLDGAAALAVAGNAAHRNPLLVRALGREFGLPCRLAGTGAEAALGAARLVVRLNPEHPAIR